MLFTPALVADPAQENLDVLRGEQLIASFVVEIARDNETRRTGLMWRTELAADKGMLFDFKETRGIRMWMKNTLLPLDMLFIDYTGVIVHVEHDTTPGSLDLLGADMPARYVLEINGGQAQKSGIEIGDRIVQPNTFLQNKNH
ncbi:MAG: uncharacterized membrane protein (UPF0127 family) [Gammaproteobacteria bacterium]|jgi:uncharacterized membrane protein (UPF0127 family)